MSPRISRADRVPMTEQVINRANEILSLWREKTGDVLMTSFKGARKDGRYRRRLSFKEAQGILSRAIDDIDTRL